MILSLVLSCNSSQAFFRFWTYSPATSRGIAPTLEYLIQRNSNCKYESPYSIILPSRFFCRYHVKRYKCSKHWNYRKKLYRTFFCLFDSFIPEHWLKLLTRKTTSVHVEICFNHEHLFHQVPFIARKMCHCNSGERLVLLNASWFFSNPDRFQCLRFWFFP